MINIILISVVLIGLIIGSITDIKKREVPDFVSFGLIAAGIGIRLLYSVFSFDWTIFLYGLLGLIFCFVISWLMFYTGQWGGGDAKVLMGLGALIGFNISVDSFLIGVLINILLMGAVYGLVWGFVLAYKNRKNFKKELINLKKGKLKMLERIFLVFFLALLVAGLFNLNTVFGYLIIIAGILPLMVLHFWVFAKAVENCCMIKYVKPKELTEGDWIVKNIKYKGKIIAGPKDLGIEKSQIRKLIKLKIKKVLIKEGIPFIPSFLMGYILTLILFYTTGIANWFLWLV